mmetsp:Transcript_9757/g.29658  ORF Transcript_9757/g.29658 Transcript_9757/m.29658 type:complete len:447 (+) Transcript_9757:431-1771(+)|eukprot:CAMPEP_0198731750 /NCGR_PEP_ID=MMETSP1475-20131203/31899_1 /TAXON_ID= ORGANISM="Unidentified sp., Strain CCMP1999" /NCGR_SAMPLE_ID=MMETSP1475 /ASSEMBLY_ACC=CAM_ASM_001111 /LENGTH=446 /DNA_ID=CAMNT_0044494755 /DNA_START=392 /DNA_END=1732 /DNA_ORIENTATION=-
MRAGNYDLKETIGRGTFGTVKRGVDMTNGREYAIKIMQKTEIVHRELTTNVRREIGIMQQLEHKNIVRLYEVLSSSRKIYMVMELVRGGELFTYMKENNIGGDQVVRKYFQQLIDGLAYCHKRGVCHRDLKPENLLVDADDVLKVTDFGVSTVVKTSADGDQALLHTACGTPYFCAPEILTNKGGGYDGYKIDAWSVGVILYRMLVGVLPFQGSTLSQLMKSWERGSPRYPPFLSPESVDLLKRLLQPDPEKRMSVREVRRHPWFLKDYEANGGSRSGLLRSGDLDSLGKLSSNASKKSDSTDDTAYQNGLARNASAGRERRSADVVPRVPSESSERDLNSSRLRSTNERSLNAFPRHVYGVMVREELVASSGGNLTELLKKLLPSKLERVPEVIDKLTRAGCDDVADLQMITEEYNTHLDFIAWLEEKAHIQPVLAVRIARALKI